MRATALFLIGFALGLTLGMDAIMLIDRINQPPPLNFQCWCQYDAQVKYRLHCRQTTVTLEHRMDPDWSPMDISDYAHLPCYRGQK